MSSLSVVRVASSVSLLALAVPVGAQDQVLGYGCRNSASAAGRAPTELREVEGPLYSADGLRTFELFGVHLGMPVARARRVLVAAGLRTREEPRLVVTADGPAVAGQFEVPNGRGWIHLYYTKTPWRRATVSGISYWRNLTCNESRAVAERRSELVGSFGQPTIWRQWIDDEGEMRDQTAYLTSRSLRDEVQRQRVHSCSLDWRCTELREKVDCRKMLKRVQVPVIEISLSAYFTTYSFYDQRAIHASLARHTDFHRDLKSLDFACVVPSVH